MGPSMVFVGVCKCIHVMMLIVQRLFTVCVCRCMVVLMSFSRILVGVCKCIKVLTG